MSTIYMSQLSALPLMEGDQDQGHFPSFHLGKDPPILFPFMISSSVEHQGQSCGSSADGQHLRQQALGESNQQFSDHMMMGRSGMAFPTPSPFRPSIQSIGSDMIQKSSYDPYDIESISRRKDVGSRSSSEWTTSSTPPAKMRVVRKAAAAAGNEPNGGTARKPRRRAQAAHQAAGDEISQQQQQAAMGGFLRVCSDCNTSKTPLWRSGPRGPKSLCNACGIRQRKARRAMAAAAANGGVVAAAAPASDVQAVKPAPGKKEKSRADVDRSLPFKKRCKTVDHATATAAAAAPPPAASTAAKAAAAGAAAPVEEDHDRVGGDHVATAAAAAAPNPSKDSGPVPPAPPFFHGFPRDEITDAAMLLMTLSCGLVRS